MNDAFHKAQRSIMPVDLWGRILATARSVLRDSDLDAMTDDIIDEYITAIDAAIDMTTDAIAKRMIEKEGKP